MDLNLSGKRVLVTGGNSGLGKAICEAFALEGASIAMNYIVDPEKTEQILGDIVRKNGIAGVAVKADVTDEDQVRLMFDEAEAALGGRIDILVNNAGICPVTMILDTSYEVWKKVMDVNVNAIFLTSKEFAKRRIESGGGGKITNIVSQAAFNGSKRGKTHYSTSKGAAVSFTISFAKEVAQHRIFVNGVAPGMIFTEMTRETLLEKGEVEKYNASIPVGRIASAEEIADSVLFISSDVASYSTGSIFDVTGGLMSR